MPPEKPRRLGRGLEALLASRSEIQDATPADRSALRSIPISRIRPNPYQPRKEFNEEELRELQASLRTNGLLNPIAVRPASVGEGFELIAGERRLRAAAALGWPEIPAIVKEIDDQTLLTLALVENLQRADLNPMEEAEGYRHLMQNFSLTQAEVAEVTGKDRSTVANLLRLLHLPASVRRMVHERQITLGHARALLTLEDEQAIVALAKEIVAKGLSVRDVEHRARQGAAPRVRTLTRSGEARRRQRFRSAPSCAGRAAAPSADRCAPRARRGGARQDRDRVLLHRGSRSPRRSRARREARRAMTTPEREKDAGRRGYGNIYTPHAGAMIIHVQRESGLANRMIILSPRQVRLLRIGAVVLGDPPRRRHRQLDLLRRAGGARPAAHAPHRDARARRPAARHAQEGARRGRGTLPAGAAHDGRVHRRAGARGGRRRRRTDSGSPTRGRCRSPGSSSRRRPGLARRGIEIAVPRGTAVRAAGDGMIVEVRDDSLYGRVVRMRHRQGYESVYGNLLDVKVARGQRVASGAVIAASGDSTGLLPAHLHFEIIRDGAQVNPATIVTKGPQHGDLQ